jgi:hypothetical protein
VKTYRRHYCERQHRHYRTTAVCLWPRAIWITGEGPYATLAWCRVLTVALHQDIDTAREAQAFIDKYACGGQCYRRHEIIHLDFRLPLRGA